MPKIKLTNWTAVIDKPLPSCWREMAGEENGADQGPPETELNVNGMIGLIVFYLIIFVSGVLANK